MSCAKLEELLNRHVDGSLSRDDRLEFERMLLDSAEARDAFWRFVRLHSLIRDDLQTQAGRQAAADTSPPVVALTDEIQSPGALPDRFGWLSQTGPLSYLVATVVLCLMLLGAWVYKINHDHTAFVTNSRRSTTSGPLDQPELVFVGRITGMKDCRWSDPDTSTSIGASAPLGREYALASGLMEITYKSGAKVILEGPCTYKVASSASGYLARGKLTARIVSQGPTASAAGAKPQAMFSVTTPTAVVTDLGTEFGVEVAKEGTVRVIVFRGAVRMESRAMNVHGRGNQKEVLRAGQAAHLDAGAERIVIDDTKKIADRFVRNMPKPKPPVKFIGPLPYQSFEDRQATPNVSPFSKAVGGPFGPLAGGKGDRHWKGPAGQYFHLEDVESGAIRATGLWVISHGHLEVIGAGRSTNSVDEDDGTIDYATDAARAHSIYHSGAGYPLRIGFEADVLGRLPSHVGIVITDYRPEFDTTVEVFDESYRLLGQKRFSNKSFATDIFHGAPDAAKKARFLGIVCARGDSDGIHLVVLTEIDTDGAAVPAAIEVDHIQYGFVPVAADASAAGLEKQGEGVGSNDPRKKRFRQEQGSSDPKGGAIHK